MSRHKRSLNSMNIKYFAVLLSNNKHVTSNQQDSTAKLAVIIKKTYNALSHFISSKVRYVQKLYAI